MNSVKGQHLHEQRTTEKKKDGTNKGASGYLKNAKDGGACLHERLFPFCPTRLTLEKKGVISMYTKKSYRFMCPSNLASRTGTLSPFIIVSRYCQKARHFYFLFQVHKQFTQD
jgi:hypothetical protein